MLDQKDFAQGKMIYFLDIGERDQIIPTILILTDKHIFRATFNVDNKNAENYVNYRQDFENIVSTFQLVQAPPPPPPAEEAPEETPEAEKKEE
jgi:hypothetical protein